MFHSKPRTIGGAILLAAAVLAVRAWRDERNVGPLFAFEAGLAQLSALREGHSAARRQAGQVTS